MKMIYKPGKMLELRGIGWVSYKTIECDAEIPSGWFDSPKEALASEGKTAEREHLEAKAKELGIGFNVRTTDETLIERINEFEAV